MLFARKAANSCPKATSVAESKMGTAQRSRKRLQVSVEGRTGGARIGVPAWNSVVTAKSEKAGPEL